MKTFNHQGTEPMPTIAQTGFTEIQNILDSIQKETDGNFSFDIANRTIRTDESIDRTQGSTHLPEFPCVTMEKPAEYHRPLTLNDVSSIR